MQKLLCVILALAFLSLAACGVSGTPAETSEASPSATSEPPEATPATAG